ncbi:hypothetical protein [Desulfovibrio sp. JC010]|uniref:hypothetical protein n=1 Tax=Desulfovibrio sp. JC010 TaxID=2593641 RepID=UPI0013D5FB05|nr:hypothetical protein [Desulfovibrio sp. JC010]NDV27863.1 hypothetical protein [Desulfovibrio sp. JC010]
MFNISKSYSKYIWAFLITVFVAFLLTVATTILMNKLNIVPSGYSILYRYQLDKIKNIKDPDVLLLGDSSLGNAVYAPMLSDLINRNVYSLALNGSFGYAGSLNMLRRALKKGKPELVVLCQALEMMTRPVSHGAYALTMEQPTVANLIHMRGVYMDVGVFSKLFSALVSDVETVTITKDTDYYPQAEDVREKLSLKKILKGYEVSRIDTEKTHYLKKIAALCKENNIPVVYFHGPIYEPTLAKSGDYKKSINEIIRNVGVVVEKETPLPIPLDKVGDTQNHVSPESKEEYTKRMADLIVKYLPSHSRSVN